CRVAPRRPLRWRAADHGALGRRSGQRFAAVRGQVGSGRAHGLAVDDLDAASRGGDRPHRGHPAAGRRLPALRLGRRLHALVASAPRLRARRRGRHNASPFLHRHHCLFRHVPALDGRRGPAGGAWPRPGDDAAWGCSMTVFRWIFAVLVMVVVVLVARNGMKPRQPPPTVVQSVKAEKAPITRTVAGAGKLEPLRKVNVSSNITGVLVDLKVGIGSVVKKGQYIGQIDTSNYRSRVDQQRSQTEAAGSDVKRAEANVAKL